MNLFSNSVSGFAINLRLKKEFADIVKIFSHKPNALLFTCPSPNYDSFFINSGYNESNLASMPLTLADGVASLAGQSWPLFAPSIGAMGSFVAGSATVSNMMFSLFQFGVAIKIGVSGAIITALQGIGAAAGNMICVANVVAASSTVGLSGCEGTIIRRVLFPLTYYLVGAGVLGLITIYGLNLT